MNSMTPGSPDAIAAGCTCDPWKNVYGYGVTTVYERKFVKVYFAAGDCQLHGTSPAGLDVGEGCGDGLGGEPAVKPTVSTVSKAREV